MGIGQHTGDTKTGVIAYKKPNATNGARSTHLLIRYAKKYWLSSGQSVF
jgi:hypothetical protein